MTNPAPQAEPELPKVEAYVYSIGGYSYVAIEDYRSIKTRYLAVLAENRELRREIERLKHPERCPEVPDLCGCAYHLARRTRD